MLVTSKTDIVEIRGYVCYHPYFWNIFLASFYFLHKQETTLSSLCPKVSIFH